MGNTTMSHDKDATDKILDLHRQQLSALFDDALPPHEARFLLRRLQHDESLAQCLSRWQLCGDVLRGHAHAPAPEGFMQRVAGAVAAEPVAGRGRRFGWAPGLALAASVAVVALFVARQLPEAAQPDADPVPVVASRPATDAAAVPAQAVADNTPAVQPRTVSTAPAPSPAPRNPTAPDSAAALAAVAVAAELPIRGVRRARGQSQRAALRTSTRRAEAEPQIAVAAATPTPVARPPATAVAAAAASTTAVPAGGSPFTLEDNAIPTRPWPSALLPGVGGAFNVGYGRLEAAAPRQHPFRRMGAATLSPPLLAPAAVDRATTTPVDSDQPPSDATP